MYSKSPARIASFSRGLPVGLIRSPISSGRAPNSAVFVYEETTVRAGTLRAGTGLPRSASAMRRMCAGVVPQQPPSSATPSPAKRSAQPQNSSGPTGYVVSPFTATGRPAFGVTQTGRRVAASRRGTKSAICSGPRLQFMPTASAPRLSASVTAASMLPPVRSLPVESKVYVTTTGRSQFSFAASSAALTSYVSLIVSISTRSALSRPATTIS